MNYSFRITIATLIAFGFLSLNCGSEDSENHDSNNVTPQSATELNELTICSFNIQFLGHFKKKDNANLADFLKGYDMVVVQELVAPPIAGNYLDGESYSADNESKGFFEAMESHGFSYQLSEEDTGTNDDIHKSSSATEWWVTFYKPDVIEMANHLPSGFLADDRSNHDDYERVPYAFAFQTIDSTMDFVLISVHLQPGDSNSDADRRKHELETITAWIDSHNDVEKDFIILGDMNIEDLGELADVTPSGYISLNDECRITNTLLRDYGTGGKPYDHVMYNMTHTSEIVEAYDMEVIDLVDAMLPYWNSTDPYPGNPYDHNLFKQYFSDHHPVLFKMKSSNDDD